MPRERFYMNGVTPRDGLQIEPGLVTDCGRARADRSAMLWTFAMMMAMR
jgi:hypothetical protein